MVEKLVKMRKPSGEITNVPEGQVWRFKTRYHYTPVSEGKKSSSTSRRSGGGGSSSSSKKETKKEKYYYITPGSYEGVYGMITETPKAETGGWKRVTKEEYERHIQKGKEYWESKSKEQLEKRISKGDTKALKEWEEKYGSPKVTDVVITKDPKTGKEVEIPVAKTSYGTYIYQLPGSEKPKELKPGIGKLECYALGEIAREYHKSVLGKSPSYAVSFGSVKRENYEKYQIAKEYSEIKEGKKSVWVTPDDKLIISGTKPPGGLSEKGAKELGFRKLKPEEVELKEGKIIASIPVKTKSTITKPIEPSKSIIGATSILGTGSILLGTGGLTGGQFTRPPRESELSPFAKKVYEEQQRIFELQKGQKEAELYLKGKKKWEKASLLEKIALAPPIIAEKGYKIAGQGISKLLGMKRAFPEKPFFIGIGERAVAGEEAIKKGESLYFTGFKKAVKTATSPETPLGTLVTMMPLGAGFRAFSLTKTGATVLSSKAGKIALAGATTIYGGSVAYELGEKYKQGKLEEVPEVVLRTATQIGAVSAGAKTISAKYVYKPIGEPMITGKPTKTGMRYRIWRMLKNEEGKIKEEVYEVKVTKKGTYTTRKIYDNKPMNKVISQGVIAEEGRVTKFGKLTKSEIAVTGGLEIFEYPPKKITISETLTESVRMKKTPETFFKVKTRYVDISKEGGKIMKTKPTEITAKGLIGVEPKGIPKEPLYAITKKVGGTETSTLYSTLGEPLVTITRTRMVKPAPTIVGASPVVGLERITQKPKKVIGIKESVKAKEKELKKPKIFVLPLISSLKPMSETKEKLKKKLKKKSPSEIPVKLPLKIPVKEKLKEKITESVRIKPRVKAITPKQSQIRSPRLVQLISERGLGKIERVTKPVVGLKFGEEQIRRRKPMEIPTLSFLYRTKLTTRTTPPTPPLLELRPPPTKPPVSIFLPTGRFPIMRSKREERKRKILYWEVRHQIPNIVKVLRIKK